jgi:NHL repeat
MFLSSFLVPASRALQHRTEASRERKTQVAKLGTVTDRVSMESPARMSGLMHGRLQAFAMPALVVVSVLALPASATAGKSVDRVVAGGSTTGTTQGLFDDPRGLAVNDPSVADGTVDPLGASTNGYVYVADEDNNRIQVFGPNGSFKFMWGRGVQTGSDGHEICDASEVPCTRTGTDDEGGEFNDPVGVAINQSNGHVYVRDRGNNRIQEFEADGDFVRAFGWDVIVATGPPPNSNGTGFEVCDTTTLPANTLLDCKAGVSGANGGQLATSTTASTGIAVDPAAPHNVFVADPVNRRVQEFTASGTFVRLWGRDVVVTGQPGDIPPVDSFEICSSTVVGVCKAGATSGSLDGRFGTNQPVHLAVHGPSGVVFASDSNASNRVMRFDSDEALPVDLLDPEINVTALTGTSSAGTTGLAVDSTGRLFVARSAAIGVLELATAATTPVHADTHYVGSGIAPNGIETDSVSGDLYLATSSPGHRVFAADSDGAPNAIATMLPASNIGTTTATVNARINSNGPLATTYRLEISRNGVIWTTIANGQTPGGTSDVPFSIGVTGLLPNTTYQSRAATLKEFNLQEVLSGEVTFRTDAVSPEVSGIRADSVEDTTARLSASVNPHSTPTSYHFEYGVGNFHTVIPLPDGFIGSGPSFIFVSQDIAGLQPGTTYQFRIVATSATEGSTVSSTETFTTRAGPAPIGDRAFELVSPADKFSGVGVGEWYRGPGSIVRSGFAAHNAERFAVQGSFGSSLVDGAQAYGNDWAFAERVGNDVGWRSHSPLTHPNWADSFASLFGPNASAPDLSGFSWDSNSTVALFQELATWGDLNASFFSDWGTAVSPTRWEIVGPTDLNQIGPGLENDRNLWDVGISSDGSSAVALTHLEGDLNPKLAMVRGLAGPSDPTHLGFDDLFSGRSVYIAELSSGLADNLPDTGPRTLVNTCTGVAGLDRTELPSVDGSGDLVSQDCPPAQANRDNRLVSSHGATLKVPTRGNGSLDDVISSDGSRVFFMSPDPLGTGVPNGTSSFCSGTGATTLCPPQLYVRQRNVDGSVTTRWISKAEDAIFGTQDASLTGTVRFEGATPDGDKVLFRTNSPLTVDDPNGGATTTPGSNSWDLYMYDLPDGPDSDPATADADPADGELTRISAGPTGNGDCNSPVPSFASGVDDGQVGALRFVSDDGNRVYFTCAAALPGVPVVTNGTITSPGGTPTTGDAMNLYLYDAGNAESWRFIARLPRSTAVGLDGCAGTGVGRRSPLNANAQNPNIFFGGRPNCMSGTSDGSFVTFLTGGRLTADDPASPVTGDVYAYDAVGNDLVRITAPQAGAAAPYPCATGTGAPLCYGEGGVDDGGLSTNKSLGIATVPAVAGDRIVFFQSLSRLLPGDTDNAYDVYGWRNGELSLITTGKSETDGAFYRGNDETGQNVYFATRDKLTWQDFDVVGDIYTARVDGGIAEPQPTVLCEALSGTCQDAGSAPVAPLIQTGSPTGVGNAGRDSTAGERRASRSRGHKKCVRGKIKRRIRGKTRCVTRKQARRLDRMRAAKRDARETK